MPADIEEDSIPDADSPEWTEERFARALTFKQLPENLQRALTRDTREPQPKPTKQLVSLHLSADVLQALRDSGPGWQARADQILRGELLKEEAATNSR